MPTTLPFQRISDYQLVQELHRGDRSLVARARHEASGESVVIKMLSGDYPEPADIARFEQEFQIGRGLDSASVIDYLDRISLLATEIDTTFFTPPLVAQETTEVD